MSTRLPARAPFIVAGVVVCLILAAGLALSQDQAPAPPPPEQILWFRCEIHF